MKIKKVLKTDKGYEDMPYEILKFEGKHTRGFYYYDGSGYLELVNVPCDCLISYHNSFGTHQEKIGEIKETLDFLKKVYSELKKVPIVKLKGWG